MMKKYLIKLQLIVAAVGFSWGFTSCDALNLAPEDYFTDGNYWKKEAHFNSAMLGLHAQLKGQYMNFWQLGEVRAGALKAQSLGTIGSASLNYQNLIIQNLSTDSPGISNWGGFYRPIMDVNLFIRKLEQAPADMMADTKRDQYLAQAYALRSLYYFYLLRTYGGVPLELEPRVTDGGKEITDYYIARSSYDETLAQIKKDIDKSDALFAAAKYPAANKSERSIWNKAATKILKADIYLWGARFEKKTPIIADLNTALAALNDIPAGQFDLLPKYLDVFSFPNKGNKEILMSFTFEMNDGRSEIPYRFIYGANEIVKFKLSDATGKQLADDPLNLQGSGSGIQNNEYNWKFFSSYEDKDLRKRGNFLDIYVFDTDKTLNRKGTVVAKYLGVLDGSERKFVDDFVLYRYAEVLLMKAEIKNALGQDPSAEINQVRQRAYGAGNPYPVHVNGTKGSNDLAIFLEKAKEMPLEGKMWFDIIRMQQDNGDPLVFSAAASLRENDLPVLDKASEAHMVRWPIDRGTFNINPLVKQNDGYVQF